MSDAIARAAEAIAGAEALLIGAGAGMGVDSGLPDFRGPEGFWRSYPPYRRLGLRFADLANPRWFRSDPELAWGFYGHRRDLYRGTDPHNGFAVLRRWAGRMPGGAFVYTSNVDGQFQAAGFEPERLVECHGSLAFDQCTGPCDVGIFPADPSEVALDPRTMRARPPLPSCPRCGALARPNVLMFGDHDWQPDRTDAQSARFRRWLTEIEGARLVVVECGAGSAVPSVRMLSEAVAANLGATLVRINPREPEAPGPRDVGIADRAMDALEAIDDALA
jgi:NAD-dependent SIR2 family protein deacetylase